MNYKISNVDNGIFTTQDGCLVKVMEFAPQAFIDPDVEPAKTHTAFANVLKAAPDGVQFKVIHRGRDVSALTNKMKAAEKNEELPACRAMQGSYIYMLKNETASGLATRCFAILRKDVSSLDENAVKEAKVALNDAAGKLKEALAQCNNRDITACATTEETINMMYAILGEKPGYSSDGALTMPDVSNADFSNPYHAVVNGKYIMFGYIKDEKLIHHDKITWLSAILNMGKDIDVDISIHKTEKGGYTASVLLSIRDDSQEGVKEWFKSAKQYANEYGLHLRRATFQMKKAYEECMPICRQPAPSKKHLLKNMSLECASSLYPFVVNEQIDENGVAFGIHDDNLSAVTVDFFSKDSNSILMTGYAGAGKTFTEQLLSLRLRLLGNRVFVISTSRTAEEFGKICHAVGGVMMDENIRKKFPINIMDIADTSDEGLQAKVDTLHSFFAILIPNMTSDEWKALESCIREVYKEHGLVNSKKIANQKMPVLKELYDKMQGVPGLDAVNAQLNLLMEGVLPKYGYATEMPAKNLYTVFGLSHIAKEEHPLARLIILDYLHTHVQARSKEHVAVFMDEPWKTLGGYRVQEWENILCRRICDADGAMFFVSQDIPNRTMGKECKVKLFFVMDSARTNLLADDGIISEEAASLIPRMIRGKCILVMPGKELQVTIKATKLEIKLFSESFHTKPSGKA